MSILSTNAKVGFGLILTGVAIATVETSSPISIMALTAAGQGIAWLPDLITRCISSVQDHSSQPVVREAQQLAVTAQQSNILMTLRDRQRTGISRALQFSGRSKPKTLVELKASMQFGQPCFEPIKVTLSGSDITDDELIKIVEMFPNIREMNLARCRSITNRGLANLANCPLTRLNLRGCDITDRGVASLRERLPGCSLTR